ncbi:hypothetical protein BDY21DRAFT_289031 [Lineolata rhizophorae]|uniref:Short-chain dehydrogenase n=1 Tax=Lineolata rhizophorae TaxID=578093 RepID=A0A6A6NVE3_9PEZI|nr:hypothetical protein BDY21DRAFT_289031 [Lineolata rhizophorae]
MSSQFTPKTTGAEAAAVLAPHIAGKTVLMTGASITGLGFAFLKAISAHSPALLILAGRSEAKLDETAAALAPTPTRKVLFDLTSLASARKAAAEVMAWQDVPAIDVLVFSAAVPICPYTKTEDGLEMQFGADYVAHWLFGNLVMGKVLKGKGAVGTEGAGRVLSISSEGQRLSPIRWGDISFQDGKTYHRWRAYGQCKTALILYAVLLAEKLGGAGLRAFSLHPGSVPGTALSSLINMEDVTLALDKELGNKEGDSNPFDPSIRRTIEQGAMPYVVAAFDPSVNDLNGKYLIDGRLAKVENDDVKPYALDKEEAEKLWKYTEELVGQKFDF